MVASPNSSPPIIQAASVPTMTKPIDRSRADKRPMRSAFSAMTASALRTDSMSIGKKRMITSQPAISRITTSGQAASVHSAKL